jgi:uncharacterized membrane protein YtjA (UPF0391 family)
VFGSYRKPLSASEDGCLSSAGAPVLNRAITFFVVAIVAVLFSLSEIAAGVADFAQMLFVIFLVLFAVSLLLELKRN